MERIEVAAGGQWPTIERHWLERSHARRWPAWLELCVHAFRPGADDARDFAATRQCLRLGRFVGQPALDGRRLHAAMRRAARIAESAAKAGAGADEHTAIADRLLWQALRAEFGLPVDKPLEPRRCAGPLPVLLSFGPDQPAMVVDLTLCRVDTDSTVSAAELFVPAPGCYLTETGTAFDSSLAHAALAIMRRLEGNPRRLRCRLVWDIEPRRVVAGEADSAFAAIDGASASASFAVAGLALLADRLPQAPDGLAAALAVIDWPRAAVSAMLGQRERDGLQGVRDIGAKMLALIAQRRRYPSARAAFVAARDLGEARKHLAESHGCATLDELVRRLADETDRDRRFGKFPDVARELRDHDPDAYVEFNGREDAMHRILHAVDDLAGRGGVVVVDAPTGWGKTALALRWVEATERPSPALPLARHALAGWAFARDRSGSDRAHLSHDPLRVVDQLEACTRYRLGAVRGRATASAATRSLGTRLADVLNLCMQADADDRQPAVLLIDGVDETFGSPAEWLPTEVWKGVVLVILVPEPIELDPTHAASGRVRSVGFRPSEKDADIVDYIARRSAEIQTRHGLLVGPTLQHHLAVASQGLFLVACGLLRERKNLPANIGFWGGAGRERVPFGRDQFESWQVEENKRAAQDKPPNMLTLTPREVALAHSRDPETVLRILESLARRDQRRGFGLGDRPAEPEYLSQRDTPAYQQVVFEAFGEIIRTPSFDLISEAPSVDRTAEKKDAASWLLVGDNRDDIAYRIESLMPQHGIGVMAMVLHGQQLCAGHLRWPKAGAGARTSARSGSRGEVIVYVEARAERARMEALARQQIFKPPWMWNASEIRGHKRDVQYYCPYCSARELFPRQVIVRIPGAAIGLARDYQLGFTYAPFGHPGRAMHFLAWDSASPGAAADPATVNDLVVLTARINASIRRYSASTSAEDWPVIDGMCNAEAGNTVFHQALQFASPQFEAPMLADNGNTEPLFRFGDVEIRKIERTVPAYEVVAPNERAAGNWGSRLVSMWQDLARGERAHHTVNLYVPGKDGGRRVLVILRDGRKVDYHPEPAATGPVLMKRNVGVLEAVGVCYADDRHSFDSTRGWGQRQVSDFMERMWATVKPDQRMLDAFEQAVLRLDRSVGWPGDEPRRR